MNIFDIVINLIESTILSLFIYLVLQRKGKYLSLLFAISIDCLNTTFCNYFLVPEFIITITTIIIFLIYANYLNRKSWIQNIFLVLCLNIMINASVSITILLTSIIFSFPNDSYNIYIFMTVFSKLLNLILIIILSFCIKKWNILQTRKLIYLLLSIFSLDIIYSSLIDLIFVDNIYNSRIITSLVMINLLTICLCIIFFESQKEQIERLSLQKDRIRLETQEKIYELNQANILEIRKWRHDIKHLFLSIKHHLTHNEIEEAISLLEQENQILSKHNVYMHSGNDLLDSILIDKHNIIKDNNISLVIECDTSDCPLNQTQFFIIVGNLLDNAIEGCINTKQKQIIISIGIQKDYYFIKMQNSITQSILTSNPRLVTTKNGKLGHGFGIRNIIKITNECNGDIHFDELNNQFIAKVLIPIKHIN